MNKGSEILLAPEIKTLLEQLTVLITSNPQQIKKIKVNEWLKKDLELNNNNLSPSTLRSIRTSYNYFLKFFGNVFIDEIGKEEVVEFRAFLFSKVTNLVYWRTLKASLNRAVDYGYLKINHFNSVKAARRQQTKPKCISKEELELILPHLNSVLKDLVLFTYLTGLRLGEACFLSWSDVDLQQNIITVGSETFKTKTRKIRAIPLCDDALRILKSRLPKILSVKAVDYVFTKYDKKAYTKDYVSKAFKKAVRASKLDEGYSYHSLRHSFASNLVNKGVPLYQVQRLLGHSNFSTTQIYSHISLDTMRDAINVLNNNQQKIVGSLK